VAFLPVLPDLPGKGIGHFVGALDIDGFIDTAEFKSRMDQWIRRFKNATPIQPDQKVIIHGSPEAALYKERLNGGIPLIDKVCKDLTELAKLYSLEHPF
jgi:LDH2 family malate/lactate/ureidoglycolate dehydrogenase